MTYIYLVWHNAMSQYLTWKTIEPKNDGELPDDQVFDDTFLLRAVKFPHEDCCMIFLAKKNDGAE